MPTARHIQDFLRGLQEENVPTGPMWSRTPGYFADIDRLTKIQEELAVKEIARKIKLTGVIEGRVVRSPRIER